MSSEKASRIAGVQRRRRHILMLLVTLWIMTLLFTGSNWMEEEIHEFIEALGVGLIAVGIAGRLWSTLYIGGRKSRELVKLGPYSITRNPLYLFTAIASAGIGMQTGSITIGLATLIICVAVFHWVILKEEAYLSDVLGDEYISYLKSVPRLFPNPFLFKDADVLEVQPVRIYATLRDGIFFMFAMPLLEIIEHAQETGQLALLLRLP